MNAAWRAAWIICASGALLASCAADETPKASCFPPAIQGLLPKALVADAGTAKTDPAAARVPALRVYLDRSESMAGYVNEGRPAESMLGNVISLLPAVARTIGARETIARPFGTEIDPMPIQDVRTYGRKAAYSCGPACENTLLDKVFSEIANLPSEATARRGAPVPASDVKLVVTDLWQDDPQAIAASDLSLGEPLRRILETGQSIGVMGIPAGFDGYIYAPGKLRVSAQRLLVVLIIGPRVRVEAAYKALADASLAAPAKFALYAPDATRPALVEPEAEAAARNAITDASLAQMVRGVPQYVLRSDKSRVRIAFVGAPKPPTYLLIPAGAPIATSRIWRMSSVKSSLTQCGSNAWEDSGAVPDLPMPFTEVSFDRARADAANLSAGTYLVWIATGLGTAEMPRGGLTTPQPTGAAAWMGKDGAERWGGTVADARAMAGTGRLITPGLDRLHAGLERDLAALLPRQRWHAAAAFVLKVE